MKQITNDPVLNLTASGLRILRWLIMAFCAVAVLATVAFVIAGFIPGTQLIDQGTEYAAVLMLAGAGALALMARFLRLLRELVLSVRDGQPLTVINAARLRAMGWLTLAVQAIMIVASAGVAWTEGPNTSDFDLAYDSIETLLIAAVLFILARVFDQGAAMQEELEGTV